MLFLSASDLESKLFPALLTLSSDTSSHVKLATIKQLCNVAKLITQESLIEKIEIQFERLLTTNGHEVLMEVLREFIDVLPAVDTKFRTMCILPKLMTIVDLTNHTENEEQRNEGYKAIVEAYKSFNGFVLTEDTIKKYILPSLRILQANSKNMDPTQMAMVVRMISGMEKATNSPAPKSDDKKKRWGK